jgi:histidinol dehydrogenase
VTEARFRFVGPLADLPVSPANRRALFEPVDSDGPSVCAAVTMVLARVRRDGDAALFELARELDRVELGSLEVPRAVWRRALDTIDVSLRRALERAATNIGSAHRAFLPRTIEIETEPGVVVGRRPDPLDLIGVYAPGGRGAYPSSVLMGIVPARIAGVGTIVLCSPPARDGVPAAVVLAAAEIAGADRVFAVGGAGAIAAMAYGTGSIPRVNRIVGPGNAFVAEAKLQAQASGAVTIDSPAGPSELLVVADASADPDVIAREMIAQAEHDPRATVVTVTDDETLARRVVDTILDVSPGQARASIVAEALRARGAVLWAPTLDDALRFAAEFAPEHLLLVGRRAEKLLADIRNAGTVFVGESSSVAFGDYMTGANHVLPTGGMARSYSGLSTADFMRWTSYQRVSRPAAAALAGDVATIAESEQLAAHASAARAWSRE